MSSKGSSLKKYISFSIFLVLSAIVGYYVGKNGVHLIGDVPKFVKIWIVVLFIPAFFVVIGIHEAGHALAGVLLKFDFKMYGSSKYKKSLHKKLPYCKNKLFRARN